MANFHDHIEGLIRKEGGYKLVDIPGDRGGRTYAGISERSNPDWPGWILLNQGSDSLHVKAAVHTTYKQKYWDPIRLDQVGSEQVAEMVFSAAVLSGPRTAIRLAQLALEIPADGLIGPQTLKALNDVDAEVFVLRYAIVRIARFSQIVQKNKSQGKFFRGWVNRVLRELEEVA